jgi:hypothetical protein
MWLAGKRSKVALDTYRAGAGFATLGASKAAAQEAKEEPKAQAAETKKRLPWDTRIGAR